MKPSKLYEALQALIGERVPLHIWGACGVGKSQIVHQVADDLDYDFLDVRAVQLDPVDLRGLPGISADQTEWVPPKFLPTSGKGILFLDELTSAPQMTQAGCYQLVLDRKLGEYALPDGWVVIAAGNPASERGVHFSMPRPFAFRNGPIEDLHAGRPCPACSGQPGISHITDEEMKGLMKSAVDALYRLLWLREHDKRSYDENLALGRRYTIDWDDPALKMPASESSPFK